MINYENQIVYSENNCEHVSAFILDYDKNHRN